MTEKEVALELEYFMKKQGAEDLSFDTIVASGKRSSLPHGKASEKVIEKGDFVTIDFGCKVNGYCSDMTRTIYIT
jgi:Xaa-Pro aminopeptidase